jgi:hypothetical protein
MGRGRETIGCTTFMLYLGIGLALAAFAFFTFDKTVNQANRPEPTPIPLTPGIVREALPLNNWETKIMVIDQLIEGKTEGNFIQNLLFKDNLLLQSRGEVIAGINMNELRDEDIIIQGMTVTITLPPTRILSKRIDNKNTYVYQRETGLLTRGKEDLETRARQQAEAQLVPAACEQKILQEAALQSEENVRELLLMLGFEKVNVKARIADCE